MVERRTNWLHKLWTPAVREFLWSTLLLAAALSLAVMSSIARRNGQFTMAVSLSLLALALAAVVTVAFVPKLLRRIRLEYLGSMRLFRVTKRGALFLFLILLIGVSTFNTGNNLLVLVLSFLLAALLVSGLVSNIVLFGVGVSLSLPSAIHAGQKTVSLLTLHNEKRFLPSFALGLTGRSTPEGKEKNDFFSQEKHFPYLRARSSLTTRLECRFNRRGVYPVNGFEVRTKFPFGFFSRGREVEAKGEIIVYPALLEVSGLLHRFPFLHGPEVQNRRGMAAGLYNIRDYQRGDDARFVHWKSTAKLSRLMVKEFFDEKHNYLQLVLSTYLPVRNEKTLRCFERVLSFITGLAYYYRDYGRSFCLYSGDFEVRVTDSGENFEALMNYLAWVEPATRLMVDRRQVTPAAVLFAPGETLTISGLPSIDYLKL